MKFGRTTRTKSKQITVGEMRRSQFISGAGSGAIVDMTKESVIMAGTDFWKHQDHDEYKIYEENLQKYLGVTNFVTPTIKKDKGTENFDLPAFRFPHWMFCPNCRRLAHEKTFNFTDHPKCSKCKKNLIPSRFVVACKNGHLNDFPYEWWIHQGQKQECTGKPELYFRTDENSSGLESISIECKTCGKKRSMAKSFSTEFKCFGNRPWLNDQDPKECGEKARTLQRGATNLYFPINASSLSIPPWSKQVQIELGKKWGTLNSLLNDKAIFMLVVKQLKLDIECNCDPEYIYDQALIKQRYQNTQMEKTWKDIMEDEYRAFLKGKSDREDEEGEFKIESEEVPEVLDHFIEKIVLAKKLREVMALRGFKRITPDFVETDTESFNRLSKGIQNWLPGMELRGEGIFIQLKEERVKEWEDQYAHRYAAMEKRMENSLFSKSNFSPRYVLLHTLSHLLIRELIMQCGYSTASIKERIYSTFSDEEGNAIDMCGILLYTSTNDSEGSLGGLVRQGTTERFEAMFLQMLESASWCSSDPLCINSTAQGVDSLNYAACHSCSLLPETSCESRNCYLDRAAIVGTLEDGDIGFFRQLMEEHGPEVVYE
jgi:hypothetical protein